MRALKQHADWELVGVVDTDTELLANIPEMGFGLDEDQTFQTIEEAVQFGERPDLAIVATPIPTHHAIVLEAMDLGLNVVCEKNMASEVFQGRQMVQAALDHPELVTAVGTQHRYTSRMWTARQFLNTDDNQIGRLGSIKWESYDWRGERRWGWRRCLADVYLEDQAVHWLDSIRYVTDMEVVWVQGLTFIPNYSDWYGSATVWALMGLTKPEHRHDRRKWTWCQFTGTWQQRGPTHDDWEFYGEKGQFQITPGWGLHLKLYVDPNDSRKFEEDGYLPRHDVHGIDAGGKYQGQTLILEEVKRGIDSNGEFQPSSHFAEAFKSFAVTRAIRESSVTGRAVDPTKYWKHMGI